MVCPTCGLDNDPSTGACARCNTMLPLLAKGAPLPADQYSSAVPRPPGGRQLVLIVLIGLASVGVLLAAGIIYLRWGNAGDPADTASIGDRPATAAPTAAGATTGPAGKRAQAETIDALLDRSIASRNKLNKAIERVDRCTDLAGALADMQAVGRERTAQLADLAKADISGLPGGESLRGELGTALRHSLEADGAYVDWARPTIRDGCADTTSRTAALRRGQAASDQAGAAKSAFLTRWNPVASGLGLATRTRDQI